MFPPCILVFYMGFISFSNAYPAALSLAHNSYEIDLGERDVTHMGCEDT